MELLPPAREQLVDVGLMADVEEEVVLRRSEDVVHGDGQFHHAEVRPQVTTGLGEHGDQFFTDLPSQLFKFGNR